MILVTPRMVEVYGLPEELMQFFGKGNMSITLRDVYEPIVGPALQQVLRERPHVIRQVLESGHVVPSWSGYSPALVEHLSRIAEPGGLTAVEYFFGLEAGRQEACVFHNDATSLLGLLLLKDEPIVHLRTFAEIVGRRMGMKLEYDEVWRMKRASLQVDWLQRWGDTLMNSPYLATVIRLGLPADGCMQFMQRSDLYIELALAGVPLSYALECNPSAAEEAVIVRRAWEDDLPADYARSLLG